jgi:hypothetical protein
MIKIEIEEVVFNLPSDWSDVSLSGLMKLNRLQKQDFKSSVEQTTSLLVAMTDITEDVILSLPIDDFKQLSEMLGWASIMPSEENPQSVITIEGVEYSPINIQTMSAGEFISLEVFQNTENPEENFHYVAAILIRPVVDGKIEKLKDMLDIEKRANIFKEKLMVGLYWPIVQSFFVGAGSSSLTNTQGSLERVKSPSKLRIVNS